VFSRLVFIDQGKERVPRSLISLPPAFIRHYSIIPLFQFPTPGHVVPVVQHVFPKNMHDHPANIGLLYCCTCKPHFRGALPLFLGLVLLLVLVIDQLVRIDPAAAVATHHSIIPLLRRAFRRVPAALRIWRSQNSQKFGDKARVPARTSG
jgi:hypothetical protein